MQKVQLMPIGRVIVNYTGFITVAVPAATIQDWIEGTLINNGWLMIATHATNGQQLDSREYATPEDRPMLTVEYSPPPPNGAPTDISLDNSSVAENAAVDTVVGALSSSDPDVGDTFTYSLAVGTGSTDNSAFNISGSDLRTSAVFDFETKPSYSIRIRTTDLGGLWVEKAFTITVTDANDAPTDITLTPSTVAENSPSTRW